MAYYDRLPFFDVNNTARISWYQSTHFPQKSLGLWIVIGVLCAHLFLVMIITCCFLFMTKVSRVGNNIWQSLAQINYDDEDDLLRNLTTKNDKEVEDLFKKEGLDRRTVSL